MPKITGAPVEQDKNNVDDNETELQDDADEKQTEISCLVPLIQRCDAVKSKGYDKVMDILDEFQSQSKWQQHKYLTSSYLGKNDSPKKTELDFRIVLYLEQGMAEMLQKKMPLAKKFFRDALKLCEKSHNGLLLQGRALMFLGNAYRKEGPRKYGKAFKYLTLAQQTLSLVAPGEDRAELNYFLGAFHLNMLSMCGREPTEQSRDRIQKYYEAVYEFSMLDQASRVHEKIQRIFPLGMANFLLDGQTEVARSRVVPESKLKRAESCLNYFCSLYPFDEQSVSMQTDYLKSRSDLAYRRGNLTESKQYLQKGLRIAKIRGYNLEVQSLDRRLDMLQKMMPSIPSPCPEEDISDLADQSASDDLELNIFTSGTE